MRAGLLSLQGIVGCAQFSQITFVAVCASAQCLCDDAHLKRGLPPHDLRLWTLRAVGLSRHTACLIVHLNAFRTESLLFFLKRFFK